MIGIETHGSSNSPHALPPQVLEWDESLTDLG
jgi:hypothetical protein